MLGRTNCTTYTLAIKLVTLSLWEKWLKFQINDTVWRWWNCVNYGYIERSYKKYLVLTYLLQKFNKATMFYVLHQQSRKNFDQNHQMFLQTIDAFQFQSKLIDNSTAFFFKTKTNAWYSSKSEARYFICKASIKYHKHIMPETQLMDHKKRGKIVLAALLPCGDFSFCN